MNDDDREDREAILLRRARFVAAAFAGLAMSSCDSHPAPCLSPPVDPDRDAGSPVSSASAAPSADAGPSEPVPQPCLSIAPDPQPMPCLSPLPNDPDAGPPNPPDAGPPKPRPHPCLSLKRKL
jgi:hypothetical protein